MRVEQFDMRAVDQQSRLLAQELARDDTGQPGNGHLDPKGAQRANSRVKPDRLPLLQLGMLLPEAWAS